MNSILRALASAWHAYQEQSEVARVCDQPLPVCRDEYLWASEVLDILATVDPDPELMWECILEIWRQMDYGNAKRVGMFAAGPMEDLIEHHGPLVIDRIEAKAKEDQAFREMLLGVWPPTNEDRPDWKRVVTLTEGLGPKAPFKPKKE